MVRRIALLALAWLALAVPAALLVVLNTSEDTVLAGHEVTVSPTLDGWATFDLGPYVHLLDQCALALRHRAVPDRRPATRPPARV